MHGAVMGQISGTTIFIAAAAVADYRPAQRAENKIKKGSDRMESCWIRTADILADVAAQRTGRLLVVGFAAETSEVKENARKKLMSKNLDVVVANDVTQAGAGFDTNTNIISIFTRDAGEVIDFPLMTKAEAAHRVLDQIVLLRQSTLTSVSSSAR
jgi:phosphopantothenoylcysteine decarboxylase/phosphopantothenate--cysteine ligase